MAASGCREFGVLGFDRVWASLKIQADVAKDSRICGLRDSK